MNCQRCEALADHVALLLKERTQLIEALDEMREAAAACFRVIASVPKLSDRLEQELIRAGVKEGFGGRAQDVLAKARGESQ
jgi:hypothetical protein